MNAPAATSSSAASRRTQADRRAATRTALLDAARALFIEKGYADTGTPEIVAKAGLTRGALYHHFTDKADLLRAVAEREARLVEGAIEGAHAPSSHAQDELEVGTRAYFEAMSEPGRALLLLVTAPAALGTKASAELTHGIGMTQLRAGLGAALTDTSPGELDAMADVLSAAFDRAVVAIAEGADAEAYVQAMLRVVRKVSGG